jgi:hypothetical protein
MPEQQHCPRDELARTLVSLLSRTRAFAPFALVIAIGLCAFPARATDITELLPAGLDSPRVFARLIDPVTGDVYDSAGEFAFPVLLDTGASGVIISDSYRRELEIPFQNYPDPNGTTRVLFEDVGVGGSDEFNVSREVRLELANNYETADPDDPLSYGHSQGPLRLQMAEFTDNPLLADLNIFGMPAMDGKVVVMDPTTVDFGGPNFQGQINTWIYNPGTPFNPGAINSDPGIPNVGRHVQLSYGDFSRFTRVTPIEASNLGLGPELASNPFIGPDPNPGIPDNGKPPVTITYGGESSTGSFLLDTGAAASMISIDQARALNIRYQPGTEGTNNPELETFDPLNPGAPGTLIPDELQYDLDITGFGGTIKRSGFYLDSLLLPTIEGNTDPNNHLNYMGAPVLVSDITLQDPVTMETLTLDGIFGMNFLVASAFIEGLEFDVVDGPFRWLTFDEPNQMLGLQLKDVLPVHANEWFRIGSGVWANANNWTDLEVPNSNTAVVLLGQELLTSGNVDLQSADRTVKTLRFNNQVASYTVTSTGPTPGKLILQANTGRATIQFDFANGRDHTISSAMHFKSSTDIYATANTLNLTGGVTWDDDVQLDVHTGVVRYSLDATDAVTVGVNNTVVIDDGAAVELAGVKSPFTDGTDHVDVFVNPSGDLFVETGTHGVGSVLAGGRTTVGGGAALMANYISASELTLQGTGSHFTLRPASPVANASAIGTLNIAADATLDVNDHAFVVRATLENKDAKYTEIKNKIVSAQNGLDENFVTKWDGPGITSSAARATNVNVSFDLVGLGVIRNSDLDLATGVPGSRYGSFEGETVEEHDILSRFTYTGDGNLDGAVTFDDYAAMDAAFFGTIPNLGWATGDINFDGVINFDDYAVVDQVFFRQGAPLSSATGPAAVPEPSTILIAVLATLCSLYGGMCRRRRLLA